MKKQLLLIGRVAVLAALLAPVSLAGHHSFTAEFDANKPVTLKGNVTMVKWVNPHAWLFIDVKQPDGKVVNWAIEFGAPSALYKRGWKPKDLPSGLEVKIEGWLAKDGSPTANAARVTLPDGRNLSAASSGSGEKY
jgi:hypothetical protein